MKILIAEDEPAFRHLLGEILVKWGYDVVAAGIKTKLSIADLR